ncbi:SRPBCC family protein [soil metagenome]
MTDTKLLHHTFTIERHFKHAPARVFAAFADIKKKRRWMGGDGKPDHATKDYHGPTFAIDSHTLDFRIEGWERWRFRADGMPMTNDTLYLDIVKDSRIIFAYTMVHGDTKLSSSHTTVELVPEGAGTKLIFTEQGVYFDGKMESAVSRERGSGDLMNELVAEVERD